ncbi:MAG: hypothetical protein IKJ60_04385 [Ruminococcus sp.]|nr:hypothetical protein [Ruminococcus sp.]
MKNYKRLFTSALAAVMTISSIAAIDSNAYFPTINDSEEYQKRIKSYEDNYQLTEQETEYFYNVVANLFECIGEKNNITKVWVFNKSKDNTTVSYSRFDTYFFEYSLKDYFNVKFDLSIEDGEAISSELSDALGYDSYFKIKSYGTNTGGNCAGISISFNTDNHEMNYMIAEKTMAILSEKYPISEKTLRIDAVNHIPHIRLQSCFTKMNGIDPYEEYCDNCRGEFYDEFYKSIDHDYIAENFRATYNPETHRVEFPDDYTQEEKLGCFSYFVENHKTSIHSYSNALAMMPIIAISDFDTEISYLDGDANHDKTTTIADAAAVFQSLANPDKYQLSEQGKFNADSKGDGLTVDDAVRIQKKLAGITE